MASTSKNVNTCNVCCEKFNKVQRKQVICLHCNYSLCRECVKQYILVNMDDTHCMNCKKHWDREFLVNNLTKVFINNDLRDHRQKILVEREKALLPATQVIVEAINDKEKVYKELAEFDAKCSIERANITNKLYELDCIIHGSKEPKERKQFIRKCGVDGCRGYLSTQWKCGICESTTCKDCLEILPKDSNTNHTCDPNNVESAKLILKDSKPCPKCAALIYKIDGCSQMYCTACNTAFDWKSMKIETGRIHNPHYYEYLRKMSKNGEIPREPGDNPENNACNLDNRMPNTSAIYNMLYNKIKPRNVYSDKHCTKIMEIVRSIFHIQAHYQFQQKDMDHEKKRLRIKYLQELISEDEWMSELQKKEKRQDKILAYLQVARLLELVGADIVHKIYNQTLQALVDEFEVLRQHANDGFASVAKQYSCAKKYITPEWRFTTGD